MNEFDAFKQFNEARKRSYMAYVDLTQTLRIALKMGLMPKDLAADLSAKLDALDIAISGG